MAIGIVQVHVERLEAAQHRASDPPGGDGPDMHPLDIVGSRYAVGDVPAAGLHQVPRLQIIADQRQNHHHDVLGDTDRVAIGDLGDRDPAIDRGSQVDMVGTDSRGDRELEVLRFGYPLGGQIGRPERLRDHDVRIHELTLELRIGPVLVLGDDQLVPGRLEEFAQAQLAGHAAQQLPRLEIDRARRRQGLAVGVAVEPGQIVAGIFGRISVDRIVVEDAQNLRHWVPSPAWVPVSLYG